MFMEVTLILYLVANAYLLRRAWKALAGLGVWRQVILVVYLIFSYTYFLMHRLEGGEHTRLKEFLCACGFVYIGMLLYLPLFTLLADLILFIDRRKPILPKAWRENRRKGGLWAFGIVVGLTFVVLFGGSIHARNVRVHSMDIAVGKDGGALKSLNVVALADIHVGPFMRVSRLEKIIDQVNALEPDVVLLLGDLMNEETIEAERERVPGALAKIRAKYGVFTCFGQHEYFMGADYSRALFKEANIRVLEDETVLVADSFYLVGRSGHGYFSSSRRRASLEQLLEGADRRKPVIVLEHTPFGLDEAAAAGVDLQLMGHTHAGQVFPATIVNNFLYELGNGYAVKGKTHFYVSSGVGVWAPPARIGSSSEIVQVRIELKP